MIAHPKCLQVVMGEQGDRALGFVDELCRALHEKAARVKAEAVNAGSEFRGPDEPTPPDALMDEEGQLRPAPELPEPCADGTRPT